MFIIDIPVMHLIMTKKTKKNSATTTSPEQFALLHLSICYRIINKLLLADNQQTINILVYSIRSI